jgi:hypothetical protein
MYSTYLNIGQKFFLINHLKKLGVSLKIEDSGGVELEVILCLDKYDI